MIKRITGSAMLLFLFLVPAIGFCADTTQFYAGIMGGYVIPDNMKVNFAQPNVISPNYIELNNGFLVGAKFGYNPNIAKKILAVELEYNYQYTGLNKDTSTGRVLPSNFNIDFHTLFLNVIARYPEGKIHPYVGVGGGLTYSQISEPPDGAPTSTDLSYQLLAGVDFDVVSNWSVGIVYKYFNVQPSFSWADGHKSWPDYVSNNIVIGINYHF
jgi:opacity protein-like surface antigen